MKTIVCRSRDCPTLRTRRPKQCTNEAAKMIIQHLCTVELLISEMQIHSLSLSSLLCFYFRSVSRDFVHSWSSVILLACEWASERASKHVLLSSYPVCRADLVRCYNVISADLRCCCCCCVSLPVILFFHSTTQNSSSTVKTKRPWQRRLFKEGELQNIFAVRVGCCQNKDTFDSRYLRV